MQKVRSLFMTVLTGVVFFLLTVSAQAISLGFNPVDQEVYLGDSVSVDLVISWLGDSAVPSLGAFDLDIKFGATILSFKNGSFGDQLRIGTDSSGFSVSEDIIDLFGVSLWSEENLNDKQLDAFILATLTFDTLSVGTSWLTILPKSGDDNYWIVNAEASPLTASLERGSITVTAPIPEPATMLLFSTGILLLAGLRRRSGERIK